MLELLRTKTFWGGIASIATGAGLIATGNVPEGVNAVILGLMSIFIRDGIRTAATK